MSSIYAKEAAFNHWLQGGKGPMTATAVAYDQWGPQPMAVTMSGTRREILDHYTALKEMRPDAHMGLVSEDYFNACHRQRIIARQTIKTNRL